MTAKHATRLPLNPVSILLLRKSRPTLIKPRLHSWEGALSTDDVRLFVCPLHWRLTCIRQRAPLLAVVRKTRNHV